MLTISVFLPHQFSQWKTYNPTFSQVEIWFRFVFVVLTFAVTVWRQSPFHSAFVVFIRDRIRNYTSDLNSLVSLLPVYVCTLAEEVFHEGLGNWAEVDVCPATIATTLQRYIFTWARDLYFRESHRICYWSSKLEKKTSSVVWWSSVRPETTRLWVWSPAESYQTL